MHFKIVRAQEPFPKEVIKSIFLLGPIPRLATTMYLSWKAEVYRILEELGYDGIVYDPEHKSAPDQREVDYNGAAQIKWEVEALYRADLIVAWIPRQFPDMPALTSNIEMGEWFKSGKMLLGYPQGTERMGYITFRGTEWLAEAYRWEVPVYHSLVAMLQAALARLGAGALRHGSETAGPLEIWQDKTFQSWYCSQQLGGHRLEDFRVEYVYYRKSDDDGRPKRRVWAIRPKVRVAGEGRIKDNELVIGRPAVVSVLMYFPHGDYVTDWRIVLVKEFRSAVMNHRGTIYELPGGSIEPLDGTHDEKTILLSAMREVEEEVGLKLDASRMIASDARQTMATLVACDNHLFFYELDQWEIKKLRSLAAKESSGQIKDNAESTICQIVTVGEAISNDCAIPLDWVNMGMVMKLFAQSMVCCVRRH